MSAAYTLQKYDVLQSRNGPRDVRDGWQDFSTLRDEAEAAIAVRCVDTSRWDGRDIEFRITRILPPHGMQVVYAKAVRS